MALKIKLNAFEGPFDLLFHLIEKNQIDINDIPIADLTEQYLDYLKDIDEEQLEVASEFLVMAATLLSIKSKMLLPNRETDAQEAELAAAEDIDPREELVLKLKEYQKYKAIAGALQDLQEQQKEFLKRSPEDMTNWWPDDFSLSDKITIRDLVEAFSNVIKRHRKEPESRIISRDPIPLSSKIRELDRLVKLQRKVYFSRLFTSRSSEAELVVTFLAVLELIKVDKIRAIQKHLFGEIVMEYRGDIK